MASEQAERKLATILAADVAGHSRLMAADEEGTLARPAMQVFSNDKGFGRKVYDPNADTWPKYAGNIWSIVEHFAKAQPLDGHPTIEHFRDVAAELGVVLPLSVYERAGQATFNTVVIVDVVKGTPTPTPRLETDAALMSTGSARPLEDAYRISQHDLVTWTADLAGLDTLDAYQLISQAGEAPVGNVCDPNYTMLAKVGKRYLGSVQAYDGMHARLRAAGAGYLSAR